MIKINLLIVSTISIMLLGCASKNEFFSKEPNDVNTSKLQFIFNSDSFLTIDLFADAENCKGFERLVHFKNNVHETVYIPKGSYFTFLSLVVKDASLSKVTYGLHVYTVPLDYREIRVNISVDHKYVHTKFEALNDSNIWEPVSGVIKREESPPLLRSGSWCKKPLGV